MKVMMMMKVITLMMTIFRKIGINNKWDILPYFGAWLIVIIFVPIFIFYFYMKDLFLKCKGVLLGNTTDNNGISV